MTLSDVIDQVQFSSDRERDIARKAFWLGANEVLSRTYGDEGVEAALDAVSAELKMFSGGIP